MKLEEKILQIRADLEKNKYPMRVKVAEDAFNCYAYALGTEFNDPDRGGPILDYVFNLGSISKKGFPRKITQVKEVFMADMDALGVECKEAFYDEPLQDGEWRVLLLYRAPKEYLGDGWLGYGFHFVRENNNGIWSHRGGCLWSQVEVLKKHPKDIDWSKKWNYDIVGYFILKVGER